MTDLYLKYGVPRDKYLIVERKKSSIKVLILLFLFLSTIYALGYTTARFDLLVEQLDSYRALVK